MSGIAGLLQAITPNAAPPPTEHYDGLEFRWKMLTFRPAEFKFEAYGLSFLAVFFAVWYIGKTINQARAKRLIQPYIASISSQFSFVRPLVSSGPALHLLYASGRRNVVALHTTLTLLPRHDIVNLLRHFARMIYEPTYDAGETLQFAFTLGKGEQGLQGEGVGVWAVVEKGFMRQFRSDRWDMTFPRLVETLTVPQAFSLYTEHSESTDLLLKTPQVGLDTVLSLPSTAAVLKSIIITDQPAVRPSKGPLAAAKKSRQLIISVRTPSNVSETDAILGLLQVGYNVADLLGKKSISPEATRKLQRTRTEVANDLLLSYEKVLKEDAPAEETAEEKRAAKKRAEREKLSDKEQARLKDLEKKRAERKAAKSQARK